MSVPYLIGLMLVLVVMANVLPRHLGGYRCPRCGARRPDGHAKECPWS